MKKSFLTLVCCLSLCLCACVAGQQRGTLGQNYISTSSPRISLGVVDSMPMVSSGRAYVLLNDQFFGPNVDTWMALYGNLQNGPMAVIAHAEVKEPWYWDSVSPRIQSVDAGFELVGDKGFDAWTYIMQDKRNPFVAESGDGKWLVRAYAQRTDFDHGKIVMEYRERLPEGVTSLTSLPFGQDSLLKDFAQRARAVFVTAAVPDGVSVTTGPLRNVRVQYIDQHFLGTVSLRTPPSFD